LGSFTDNQKDAYVKKRKTQPKGEANANAKLTNAQAKAIRGSYSNGMTQMQLAAIYGVSQRVISLIVRGETYK
jgi:DNA-binding transcriptional regulator YiaG